VTVIVTVTDSDSDSNSSSFSNQHTAMCCDSYSRLRHECAVCRSHQYNCGDAFTLSCRVVCIFNPPDQVDRCGSVDNTGTLYAASTGWFLTATTIYCLTIKMSVMGGEKCIC
jgi:hypothetical protein